MITDEKLNAQVDACVAVDRALNAAERGALLEFHSVGGHAGPSIAEWISGEQDNDRFLDNFVRWFDTAGDSAVAYLMALTELPETVIRRLLYASLQVAFGTASASMADPWAMGRRTHVQIAHGAALWVRGHAEALGWEPHQAG